MAFEVLWTRKALKLPDHVRDEVEARLKRVQRHFPEVDVPVKIDITRRLDGMAFQSHDGRTGLWLDIHRSSDGHWSYPTHWTIAHELMHLAQFNSDCIPSGERPCDVFALARLPPGLIDDSPSYLVVPPKQRKVWRREDARRAHVLAKDAIRMRRAGLKRYAQWWEDEFERRSIGR